MIHIHEKFILCLFSIQKAIGNDIYTMCFWLSFIHIVGGFFFIYLRFETETDRIYLNMELNNRLESHK